MVPVARRNLVTEKVRLAISVAGVGFAVLLILVVVSMYRGWSSRGGIIEELPGDLWVVQKGTTDPFHSVSLVDANLSDRLAEVEGVGSVTKAYARTMGVTVGGENVPLYVMALDGPPGLDQGPTRFFPEPGTIAIDRVFAKQHGLGVGDSVSIAGKPLRVAEVYSGGNVVLFQFAFVSSGDAAEIYRLADAVSYHLVSVAEGASRAVVAGRIESLGAPVDVYTSEGFAATIREMVNKSFLPVVAVIVLIGFVVGVAVIGLTTYTATIERARDFGVLKAIGATAGYLYRIIISQSLMVGVLGFVVGLGGSFLVARLATQAVPEFVTDIRWYDVLAVFAASLVMAVLSAYLPVRRIAGIDPASVFRA